ncbi:dihydroneopterin aldolase [Marinobacter sp. X15-166B]|uniref:dihydroneopterin aldolase n=1 Tax=Marinobacter sp. X15-166B TaxID=1897620 RepID=UPI00085BD8E5|nr:dihydroneopterin aldolase [Marinobacter sp. X15-166B]OEY66507.1 dihydroneopterin aldolase [Marinobacter sp. X15-166B]
MSDLVLIEGLAVEAVIGVYEWEREVTQRLLIDLEMAWDNTRPAASDDVALALDYATVSARVRDYLQSASPELLETAAEGLAACLRAEFGMPWLRLTLRKPGAVPEAEAVGVRIERGVRG